MVVQISALPFPTSTLSSLDKILKAEVFVHTDSQLKAAHLILDYIPISSNFQAPKVPNKGERPSPSFNQHCRVQLSQPGTETTRGTKSKTTSTV